MHTDCKPQQMLDNVTERNTINCSIRIRRQIKPANREKQRGFPLLCYGFYAVGQEHSVLFIRNSDYELPQVHSFWNVLTRSEDTHSLTRSAVSTRLLLLREQTLCNCTLTFWFSGFISTFVFVRLLFTVIFTLVTLHRELIVCAGKRWTNQ